MNFPFLKWSSISSEVGRLFKSWHKTTAAAEIADENYDSQPLTELGEEFAQKRRPANDPTLTPLQRRMLSGGA